MFRAWKLFFLIGAFALLSVHSQDDDMPAETEEGMTEGDDMPPEEGDDVHAGEEGLEDGGEGADDGEMPPEGDDEGAEGADDVADGEDAPPEGDDAAEGEAEGEGEIEVISAEQVTKLHALLDTNKDGKVSTEEIHAFSKSARTEILKKETADFYEQVDANKDAKVSLEELLEANFGTGEEETQGGENAVSEEDKAKMAEEKEVEKQKFKIADTDKDGFLNKEEMTSVFYPEVHGEVLDLVAQTNMKAKDKDKDGLLTPEEFWGSSEVDGESKEWQEQEYAALDADKDGKLSLKEVIAWESGAYHLDGAMTQLFEGADADKDGMITVEELEKARSDTLQKDSMAMSHLSQWAQHYEL